MRSDRSVPPTYFDAMYAVQDDPWGFATHPYEAAKYRDTMDALTRERYGSAFEIGCSIGVLSEKLAHVADTLLAVDVSAKALELARERCRQLPQARFELMRVPQEFPDDAFDLIVVSEVGYYWSHDDLIAARAMILDRLSPGGELLLVHWTSPIHDAPLTGDVVHDVFLDACPTQLRCTTMRRAASYRLDLLTKTV